MTFDKAGPKRADELRKAADERIRAEFAPIFGLIDQINATLRKIEAAGQPSSGRGHTISKERDGAAASHDGAGIEKLLDTLSDDQKAQLAIRLSQRFPRGLS